MTERKREINMGRVTCVRACVRVCGCLLVFLIKQGARYTCKVQCIIQFFCFSNSIFIEICIRKFPDVMGNSKMMQCARDSDVNLENFATKLTEEK